MRTISYAQAGMDALIEEMQRDATTFHLATSAPDELVNEFGAERVRATPIAEGAFTGIAIGAAGSGYRPIINWGMITFSFVAMDQIVNQAAKIHYMFGGPSEVSHHISCLGRRRPAGCRPTLPESLFYVYESRGIEDDIAFNTLRYEGSAQIRHPRQQPRYLV